MDLKARVLCLVILSFLLGAVSCRSMISQYVHTERNETVLLEAWKRIQNNIRWIKDEVVRRVLPLLLRLSGEVDLSPDCTSSLQKLVFALTRLELWALRMMDAMGKLESGYLEGTTSSFGSYDECLSVVATGPSEGEHDFVGQYCTVDFTVPLPPKPDYYTIFETIKGVKNITADNPLLEELKHLIQFAYVLALRFGVCVPSTCTKEDITTIAQKIGNVAGVIGRVSNCEVKRPLEYTAFQIAMIVLLLIIAVVTLACTVLDAYPRLWSCGTSLEEQQLTKLSFGRQLIRVFSINHHVVRLLRPKTDSSLGCLYGIKFFTFTWIIIGQSYIQVNYQLIRELRVAKSIVQSLAFQPVVNAALAMDSLFFLTGLLIAYGVTGGVQLFGRKSFSAMFFIVKKLWRVVPLTAMGVGLSLMFPLVSDGPVWRETVQENMDACYKNWWATLIFVQNFLPSEHMCMPHLWYFAVDMQLYLVALLFLLIYIWNRNAGIIWGLFMVFTSCALSGFLTFWLRGTPTMIIANPDLPQMRRNLYITQYLPHVHLGPYAVGLLMGTYLSRKPSIRVPRWMQYVLWTICIAVNASVCYGIVIWNRGKIPGQIESVFYSAFSRTAWSLGLAWMVIACYSGCGGIVNRVMSWSPFVMLSRLVFPAYLMHLLVIWFFVGKQKTSIMGQQHQGISLNVSGISSCLFIGFITHCHLEGPLIQLGKVLMIRFNLFPGQLPSVQDTISKVNGDLAFQLKNCDPNVTTADQKGNVKTSIIPQVNVHDHYDIRKKLFVYRL